MKTKSIIRYLAGLLIVGGTIYFFVREFYKNFDSISQFSLNINWFYLFTAQLLLVMVGLFGTYLWQLLLKIITSQEVSFKESIAVVNTSQLTKYLPGKFWSFAVQMMLLSKKGISKTVVVFVNSFMIVTSLFVSALLGLLYFVLCKNSLPQYWLLLLIFLIIYFGFIFLNQPFFKLLVKIVEKVFKITITYTPIDVGSILKYQLFYLLANAVFGMTGYLLALGLGFPLSLQHLFAVIAFLIIADAVGFIVLVAPGGLGVREGIMFALLVSLGDKNLALLLPLGTRIMSMISDLLLGGVGFLFLKKYYTGKENRKIDERSL